MGWKSKLDDYGDDLTDREIERAFEWLDALGSRAGSKVMGWVESLRAEQRSLRQKEDAIEKAHKYWDWAALEREGIISEGEAELAQEILARYSP